MTATDEKEKPAAAAAGDERIIWRAELAQRLQVSSECIRRYLRDGKLPKPDVDLSTRSKGWRVSTLRAGGINLF